MFHFKYSLIIFFFNLCLIYGQSYRFTYNYKFISDTLKKDSIISENMILDINSERSIYLSMKKNISDSTMLEDSKKGLMTMPDSNISTRYIIKKKYPNLATSLITDEFSTSYKFIVSDERPMDWKLTSEKITIGEYDCQKAEIDFAGRHWIAWFTEKIPFHDGPYKFRNLPGLIVRIEDSKRYHIFQLENVKKINNESIYDDKLNKGTKIRNLDRQEFIKFYKAYRKDPAKEFKQKAMSGDIYYESEEKRNEHMRLIEKLREERVKKDNNNIEIDLLKN